MLELNARRPHGLSLIEMLVVLTIVSILLSAAVPSYQELLRNQALKAAASEWMASIQRARSTAVRSGTTVDILATQAQDWNRGWVVARDTNDNRSLDSGEQKLHAYGPIPDNIEVTLRFNGKPLQFRPSGRPAQSGHVLLAAGALRRKIIVNMLGRPRLCDPDLAGADC